MEVISYLNPKIFSSNTYFIKDESNNSTIVVDPGDPSLDLIKFIKKKGLIITDVLLTHAHFDHIGGINNLIKEFNPRIYMHKLDKELLQNPYLNASYMGNSEIKADISDEKLIFVEDLEELNINNIKIKVIHTPFHTRGSVCYYLADQVKLFSGDTLFEGSIGRYDLPTSEPNKINSSLAKLTKLNPNSIVYTGHGPTTILKNELF